MDTRNWICPALCGCEIQMTAKWAGDAITTDPTKRVSYQHPVPLTPTDLKIINVCSEHKPLAKLGVKTDPYPELPGYLKRPIPNATEAESLYVHLYSLSGQTMSPSSCNCRISQVFDRFTKEMSIVQHPVHTAKCEHHLGDDDNHSQVFAELKVLNKALVALQEKDIKHEWYFDSNRKLHVKLESKDRKVAKKLLGNSVTIV